MCKCYDECRYENYRLAKQHTSQHQPAAINHRESYRHTHTICHCSYHFTVPQGQMGPICPCQPNAYHHIDTRACQHNAHNSLMLYICLVYSSCDSCFEILRLKRKIPHRIHRKIQTESTNICLKYYYMYQCRIKLWLDPRAA